MKYLAALATVFVLFTYTTGCHHDHDDDRHWDHDRYDHREYHDYDRDRDHYRDRD